MIERRTRLNLERLERRDVPSATVQQALPQPLAVPPPSLPTETISINFTKVGVESITFVYGKLGV
jgi:hypothetical protein